MAISVDNRNNGAGATGASSLSWTHSISTLAQNTVLIVGAETGNNPAVSVSSVTWNNSNLSNSINAIAATQSDGNTGLANCSLWFLSQPQAGTFTIIVTPSGTASELQGGSASYANVSISGTFNNSSPQKSSGASSDPSVSVTSATGELVVDCVVVNLIGIPTATPGAGQTQISNQNRGSGSSMILMSDEAGAASVTMSWSGIAASGSGWGQVGASIRPFAGPTITVQPSQQVVYAGQTATFSVTATASSGVLSYQWQKNGGNVGTNSSSYTTPATTLADNTAIYQVIVTDSNGSVTSLPAYLLVQGSAIIAFTV